MSSSKRLVALKRPRRLYSRKDACKHEVGKGRMARKNTAPRSSPIASNLGPGVVGEGPARLTLGREEMIRHRPMTRLQAGAQGSNTRKMILIQTIFHFK